MGCHNDDMTQSADVSGKGRVLVVDDDASLAEMLTIVLRQEGFDSRMVGRGDEAMDVFHEYRPDQAAYIGVPVEGPYKPDHYRY